MCNPDVTAMPICNRYAAFNVITCLLLFTFCYVLCSLAQQNVRVVFEWQNTIFGDLSNYLVQKASIIHHSVVFAHHRITCQGYTSIKLSPYSTIGLHFYASSHTTCSVVPFMLAMSVHREHNEQSCTT